MALDNDGTLYVSTSSIPGEAPEAARPYKQNDPDDIAYILLLANLKEVAKGLSEEAKAGKTYKTTNGGCRLQSQGEPMLVRIQLPHAITINGRSRASNDGRGARKLPEGH